MLGPAWCAAPLRKQVERKTADPEALRRELQGLIGRCRRGTVDECRIIGALSPAEARNTP